jgi:hypothetical protein
LEGRRDVGVVREIGGADNPSSRTHSFRGSPWNGVQPDSI